jgi:hypothetical protein
VLITRGKDKGMNAVLLDLVDQYAKLELPSGHIMTVTLSDIEPYIENTYTEEPLPDNSCRRRLRWVLPGIIVRVINKKIHKGRLYNLKLKVSDVLDDFRFTLLGKDSILYDDLSEKHVETVIPSTGSNVMILKGPHRASIGKLLERDRKRNFVIVHSEDGSTLNLRQDDISEVSLD